MKGIHPEFLLGLKGSEIENLINDINLQCNVEGSELHTILAKYKVNENIPLRDRLMYETEQFRYSQSRKFFETSDSMGIKIKTLNRVQEWHRETKQPLVYRPSKEFFNTVAKLRREIPFKYIGLDKAAIYIRIPRLTINGDSYNGAYICVTGNLLVTIILIPERQYTIMGSRVVMLADHTGSINLQHTLDRPSENGISERPDDATTVIWSDMIFTSHQVNNGIDQAIEIENFNTAVVGIINTAIYVNSQDPVIEELKPMKLLTKKQLGQLSHDKRENLCTLPIRLVNWTFHTGREYRTDTAFVATHMRWQPCGPDRKDVKLIWVKEHTRNYGKEVLVPEVRDSSIQVPQLSV